MKNLTILLALGVTLLLGSPTLAHHSFATTYKLDETNTVEGVVTEFNFRNPHAIIRLDVKNDDDTTTSWMVEGAAATIWRRAGWKNDSLKPGDMLRITGAATIDGSPMISIQEPIQELYMLNASDGSVLAKLNIREDPAVALGNATAAATSEPTELTFLPATLPTGEPNFTGTTAPMVGFITGRTGENDPAMPYNAVGERANLSEEWSLANDAQVFCDLPGLVRQAAYTTTSPLSTKNTVHAERFFLIMNFPSPAHRVDWVTP